MKLLVLLLLLGCTATVDQELSKDVVYRRDMIVTANGVAGEGVMVLPKATKYDFLVEARGDLDLFVLTSCNREWTKERAWNVSEVVKVGWFGWGERRIMKKRQVSFAYIPNGLERDGACPIWLGGFDQAKGKHSWAFIDFEDDIDTLPAKVFCNGETINSNGVSVCQSKNDLIQAIQFSTEVIADASPEGCKIDKQRGTFFEMTLVKGECSYLFKSIRIPRKSHRLTTIGYETILIRESL